MTGQPTGLFRLADLDYGPLAEKPDKNMLAAYRARCEVPGYDEASGFDEQKAPVPKRKPDAALWGRRYQLNAFAAANGMTYVFRSDPKHWPGMLSEVPMRWPGQVSEVSKLRDLLQGSSADGRRFMACGLEIVRCRGAITGRDIRFDYYLVVALQLGATTKQVYLKHRRRTHSDAADLLQANYTLDDPFAVMWTPRNEHQQYGSARSVLAPELLALILRVAPGYDLFVSGGWLYLMKPYSGFSDIEKKHAAEHLLGERFVIAAELGPALAAASTAKILATEQQPKQRERKAVDDADLDRRASAFVEKLKAQHREGDAPG